MDRPRSLAEILDRWKADAPAGPGAGDVAENGHQNKPGPDGKIPAHPENGNDRRAGINCQTAPGRGSTLGAGPKAQ